MTTSDYEQHQVTASDCKWLQVTASDYNPDYEWLQVTTSDYESSETIGSWLKNFVSYLPIQILLTL